MNCQSRLPKISLQEPTNTSKFLCEETGVWRVFEAENISRGSRGLQFLVYGSK